MQRARRAGTTTASWSVAAKCFLRLRLTPRQPVTSAGGVTNPGGDGEIFPILSSCLEKSLTAAVAQIHQAHFFKFSFLNPTSESRKEARVSLSLSQVSLV